MKRGPRVRIRILAESTVALGPGKADLLERIAATGSISAAARAAGMSYRRAWILVDTMNACFTKPLVATAKGGAEHGGATLTSTGKTVLHRYRRLAKQVDTAFAPLLTIPRTK